MAALARQRWIFLSVLLNVVHLTEGYSFKNCIEDPSSYKKRFTCTLRKDGNIFALIGDLPDSAVNVTISMNPVWNVPNGSFSHLPQLKFLRLDHNNLKMLEERAFQNLHCLQTLNLSLNSISELSPLLFKDLHNLFHLSLTHNRLKVLPESLFSTVPALNTLLLRQNFFADFSEVADSVSLLGNLTILDLCFNKLTSLSSKTSLPKNLTILYLCRNNLSTLSNSSSFLSHIKLLDLSYNPKLPSIVFKGMNLSHINYIRLRSTNVKALDLFHLTNVHPNHVDFSGMGLKSCRQINDLCKYLRVRVKTVEKMMLGSNGIVELNSSLSRCPQIIGTVDVSRNNLKSIGCLQFLRGQRQMQILHAEHNHITSLQSCKQKAIFSFKSLNEISFRYNRILSVNSFAFHHTPNITTLKLNINTIAYLDREALNGLKSLQTLRLDNNLLTDLFEDTFRDLKSLKTLNLRNNRIAVIFNGTFVSLARLTTLDLGGNKISHIEPSGLKGLKSLSNLYLDGNNLKEIDGALYGTLQNTLKVLDLQSNEIRFLSEKSSSPFINLTKLSDLKLDGQRPYGIHLLPYAFFQGLHSLRSLYLTNNRIAHLAPNAFDDLNGLRFLTLDNSCAGVMQLQPGVFKNLRNLTKLFVENMGIQKFSREVFGNLTKLHTLQLNHNVMQSIAVEALEALPRLRYLDIRDIPLSCTCQNSILQSWTKNNSKVQITYLYTLPCQDDNNKFKFYNFDSKVCFLDVEKYIFIATAVVAFMFTIVPIFSVKLYWQIKYSFYVFNAWFREQWRRLREEEEQCKYDAFISYNYHDESWILDELLPNLEGNGSSFKLCLHHRDFELGRNIVDNIVSAVYNSRKTICMVSQNFLQSEWCSLEIQLASYRLFDEHRDVLLLVFLEAIPERKLSSYHRMRKVMLKKTYLQWPGSDCINPSQAQDLFWKQLRRALRRVDTAEEEEEADENRACKMADGDELDCFVDQTSDEKY